LRKQISLAVKPWADFANITFDFGICRLVCQSSDRCKSDVNGSGGELAILQVNAVSRDHSLVEG